jgi:hypothetical protein
LFGDEEKEMFVRMMRKQAVFCGVDVLAYCMMSNHFHILARVRHEEGYWGCGVAQAASGVVWWGSIGTQGD